LLQTHLNSTFDYRSRSVVRGLIPFEKQGEKKSLFERTNQVNEQRFNYINLPRVHSKNKRLTGFIDFKKTSPRLEIFPEKAVQVEYEPKRLERRIPSYVRMGIVPFRE
jgi:hypothetical protein